MFARKAFITNSSSSTFVAYGIPLPSKEAKKDLSWEDYYLDLTGIRFFDSKIGFETTQDNDDSTLFVGASQQSVSYGYVGLVLSVDPGWEQMIKEACELLGIDPVEPRWFAWNEPNY